MIIMMMLVVIILTFAVNVKDISPAWSAMLRIVEFIFADSIVVLKYNIPERRKTIIIFSIAKTNMFQNIFDFL